MSPSGRGLPPRTTNAAFNFTQFPEINGTGMQWPVTVSQPYNPNSAPKPSSELIMDLEIRFAMYTVCGAIVLFVSLLVIIVFSSTKEFRTRYALFNALAIADFINGLAFVVAGVYRTKYIHDGTYFTPVSNYECIWQTPWAVLMIISGQLPAFLNLCLSLERVVALEFSSWYRRIWREHYKHYLVLACFALTGALLAFVLLLDKFHFNLNPDRICAVMNSTGLIFGTVHYSACAAIFLICFIILVAIFHKTNRRKRPTKDERRRQLMLQSITALSVVLVSIPNIVLILNEWKTPEINPALVGVAYCLYALHSALSLPIYLHFRPDFRKRFMQIFLWKRLMSSEVTTINRKSQSDPPKITTQT